MLYLPGRQARSMGLFIGVVLVAVCAGLLFGRPPGIFGAPVPSSAAPSHLPAAPVATAAAVDPQAAAAAMAPADTSAAQTPGWACAGPVSAAWGGAGLGDGDQPRRGNGGYHITHYDVTLDIDSGLGLLAGHAVLSGRAERVLDAFNLDFAGMDISRLSVNGSATRHCMDDAGELTVIPGAALPAGQPFTVTLDYDGWTNLRPIRGGEVGWRTQDGGFYAANGNGQAPFLYPSNENGVDGATYRLAITVPKPYKAIATCRLSSAIEHGAKTTYVWEMDEPEQGTTVSVDR